MRKGVSIIRLIRPFKPSDPMDLTSFLCRFCSVFLSFYNSFCGSFSSSIFIPVHFHLFCTEYCNVLIVVREFVTLIVYLHICF